VASAAIGDDALRLDGKRALVTGASRGIGRATAEALASAGAAVAFNYARSAGEAQTVADSLRAAGAEIEVIGADVADSAQVQAMFDQLRTRWGGVDIVVNNAAMTHDGFVMLMTPVAWDEVVAVNLRGTFLCAPGVAADDRAQVGAHHQRDLARRAAGQIGRGQLRRCQGRLAQLHQVAGA
jgi:3-oxoacyl-[acyl-carrier protein] reductase